MTEENKITMIIAFRDEGDEIERTVQSIRETTDKDLVPIILVDDASQDGVDYKAVAKKYDCKYFRLPEPSGPAIARTIGVSRCATDKFAIMDGHMRFYEQNWNERVCKVLNENRNAILCSGTTSIVPGKEEENRGNSGACIEVDKPGADYTAVWSATVGESDNVIEVPCVLGAFYATTRSFWELIKGLEGLTGYGFDEPYMSLKAWYLGGKCLLLRDFYVGHLYREKFPNAINGERFYTNQMMLIDVFTLDSAEHDKRMQDFRKMFNAEMLEKMDAVYAGQKKRIDSLKDYIYKYKNDENIARLWKLNAERHQ